MYACPKKIPVNYGKGWVWGWEAQTSSGIAYQWTTLPVGAGSATSHR